MTESDRSSSGLIELGMWIVVVSALVFGGWWLMRPYVMFTSFYTSFYVFKYVYAHLSFLMTDSEFRLLTRSLEVMPSIRPKQMGFESLYTLFKIHGFVLRWPVVIGLIYMGWSTRKGVVRFKYRRTIRNVYDLMEIQAKHFPASKIVLGKNLLNMHLYDGPWQTYAIPIDFALDMKLLWTHGGKDKSVLDHMKPVDESIMVPIPPFSKDEKLEEFSYKRERLPHYRYTALNLVRANDVFASQLGPLWSGPENLPPMERGLYAAFCAQAAGEAADAMAMINRMAFSWVEAEYDKNWKAVTPHHCDTTGAEELIAKYGSHPDILAVHKRHAHTYNVLYGVLHLARSNGRLYHSNFLWLRPVNRTLFIHLCSHGGQCGYWEVAGLWAHYQIEVQMGKKLVKPMVFSAVYAFHDVMSREHWIEPGEYSEDAQRRQVEDANKTFREGVQATNGPASTTSWVTKSNARQPADSKARRGDHGNDVP